jgi:hypothetical protein
MAYKLLFLIFIFIANISYSNIIYDKNNIVITDIEIENYISLYQNNNAIRITKNKAIKNIVLMKQTINFLLKNNSEFMKILDQNIKNEFGEKIIKDQNTFNFIRYQKIRNEFISEYFQNNFNIKDLEIIFSNFDNLKIPISKNKCLTIDKVHTFNNEKSFIKSFYNNLKSGQKKFEIIINNKYYDACINDKSYKNIENLVIQFIESRTEKNFNEFIYRKIN